MKQSRLLFKWHLLPYIGLLLLALGLIGCASSPESEPFTFTRLDEPTLGFLMEYPSAWIRIPMPYGDHGDLTAKFAITTAAGTGVEIYDVGSPDQGSLAQKIAEKHLEAQQRSHEIRRTVTYELLSGEHIEVDGITVLVSRYKSENRGQSIFDSLFGPGEPNMITEVAFQAHDKAYLITFTAPESAYSKMQSVFQYMIESIRVRSR